jgi:hypothetical protein
MKKKKAKEKHETSPVRHLQLELQGLRRELRTTARVYARRLEHDLSLTTAALDRYAPAEKLNREQLHLVHGFAIMLRPSGPIQILLRKNPLG